MRTLRLTRLSVCVPGWQLDLEGISVLVLCEIAAFHAQGGRTHQNKARFKDVVGQWAVSRPGLDVREQWHGHAWDLSAPFLPKQVRVFLDMKWRPCQTHGERASMGNAGGTTADSERVARRDFRIAR